MRTGRTAAVTLLAGVLGLSVLGAPEAHAADTGITVSNIVVNDGKPIVVGTSKVVEPPLSFDITLPSGYSTADPFRYDAFPFLYRGDLRTAADTGDNYIGPGGYTCYEQSAKRAHCEGDLYIDPDPTKDHVDSNADATTWKVAVSLRLFKAGGGLKTAERETRSLTVALRRSAKLTAADAAPEPVTKGRAITVAGKLTRANWSTKKYDGYGGRTVSLQFRAAGTDTFKTVKKVTSGSTGALRTTVTASVDGSFRWVYNGNTTTGTAAGAADAVDVR
ncbi:hypothetical protein [Streptomyces sp. DSM 15324]|uniref:hypothetical protein n=1 Tax=Streptomyces sp. DSM 15324 TaxID=1739111 RepID=UPI000747C628|nr:hypothetical protein [Streptomyces sp. DSM 15324]KUO12124.1 hypothetical protein AQJ58_13405 [Streptomyces sp. DSM 15324]